MAIVETCIKDEASGGVNQHENLHSTNIITQSCRILEETVEERFAYKQCIFGVIDEGVFFISHQLHHNYDM